MGEASAELRRLAGCADIPRYRRKALLRIADKLDMPPGRSALYPDLVFDPYYRRNGYRMRKTREIDPSSEAIEVLLLEPPHA
jgi:hypothetical protein